jgi:hypothetical protein
MIQCESKQAGANWIGLAIMKRHLLKIALPSYQISCVFTVRLQEFMDFVWIVLTVSI